jgi:hypothetical protein
MVQSAVNQRMTAKALLRRVIVTTSVPPIIGIYRAIYRLLIRAAVWRLKQAKSVRAIYLRRGLAAGAGVPGISDIDLAAVGDWDAAAQARVTESYQRLARWCPIFDPTVGVYTPASMAELRSDPFHRHRLAEGQRHWKLLFGKDYLRRLEPVTTDDASLGQEAEIKVWWTFFARQALSDWQRSPDQIFLNSLCYKVAAECIRIDCGLRGGPLPESREQAIEQALANTDGDPSAFLAQLRESAQRRHLRYRGEILDDTYSFLLPFLERLYRNLACDPGWRALPGVVQRIDAPLKERIHSDVTIENCRRIGGANCRPISIASGAAFVMDDIVLLLEPDSGGVPAPDELRAIARACAEAPPHPRSRVSLYLRLTNAAYQFYASDYFREWQAVLSPGLHPDIWTAATRLDSCLNAVRGGESTGPFWTGHANTLVRHERMLLAHALDNPVVYKANNLDFLRTFWKFLELAVIEATAKSGEIVFAQTPEAVGRGLAQLNLPCAPFLKDFATAYREELRGAQADIGRYVPPAILYLKNIHHAI